MAETSKTYFYTGIDTIGAYIERQMAKAGAVRAESAAQADVALTFCPYPGMLEDAYFDDGGLIKTANADTLLIDLSPSTPTLARELSAVAAVNDLAFAEAPLAVTDPLAQDALAPSNLVCYAAGESEDVEAARPVLEYLAASVKPTGASGSAQLAKAVHTIELASRLIGAAEAEALIASASAGAVAADAAGFAGITGLTGMVAPIRDSSFNGTFATGLLLADIAAAMSAADDVELILPQLEAAMHLFELLSVIGGADMDPSSLKLLYRSEDEGAAHGLDWERAETFFEREAGAAAHHDHRHGGGDAAAFTGFDSLDDYDDEDDGYDDEDDDYDPYDGGYGFAGGFGYSPN